MMITYDATVVLVYDRRRSRRGVMHHSTWNMTAIEQRYSPLNISKHQTYWLMPVFSLIRFSAFTTKLLPPTLNVLSEHVISSWNEPLVIVGRCLGDGSY